MAVIRKLTQRYPKLPALFANTMVSKVIQIIKDRALEPALDHPSIAKHIQNLPQSLQKMAEWVCYFLSGAVRTMPERGTVLGIIVQEALAESMTHVGIKINELSVGEYGQYSAQIVDVSLPMVRGRLTRAVKEDSMFRNALLSFFGTATQWSTIIQDASGVVSQIDEQTKAHRDARKAGGWLRFFWRRF